VVYKQLMTVAGGVALQFTLQALYDSCFIDDAAAAAAAACTGNTTFSRQMNLASVRPLAVYAAFSSLLNSSVPLYLCPDKS